MRPSRTSIDVPRAGRAAGSVLLAALLIGGVGLVVRSGSAADPEHLFEASLTGGVPAETIEVEGAGHGLGMPDFATAVPNYRGDIPAGGYGIMARGGHIAGQTVGREESITHIELAPYLFVEETMLLGDWRLFRTNEGGVGGSAGLGLRHFLPDHNFVLGGLVYYDIDDSRESQFQQMSLALELLSEFLDVRTNWYVPVGRQERVLGTSFVSGSQRFEEHFLLFDTRTEFGTAADGIDMTFTSPVPGEFTEPFNVEASAGWYHFQVPNTDLTRLWGWKLRLDADFFDRLLHTFVEFTSDREFDNNVIFGASVNYYHDLENRPRIGGNQYHRMSEWVRRNYNVVTINDFVINEDVPVINPDTGDPYVFAHVRNLPADSPLLGQFPNFPAPAGTGTVEMPFQYIREAQAAEIDIDGQTVMADVIYVHGESVFDEQVDGQLNTIVRLNDSEILLGEGVQQRLPAQGFGQVTLPVVVGGNRPIIRNTSVDAVVVADDNLMGGFEIRDTGGNAFVGTGIVDGTFRDITIDGATGDGVLLTSPAGNVIFERVGIANADGHAFHVDGGAAVINFTEQITNTNNFAVLIENTFGGAVDFRGTTITDTAGAGILLQNNQADVTFDTGTITDSTGTGIQILDTAAESTISFLNDFLITNPTGVGLDVDNFQGTLLTQGNITINQRNAIGADFTQIGGTVQFFGDLNIGPQAAAAVDTGPALNYQNSSGTVQFNNITISDDPAISDDAGINIGDINGVFINEPGAEFIAIGTTTISNTFLPGIQIHGGDGAFDPTSVEFNNVNISAQQTRGIEIFRSSGPIAFTGTTTVTDNPGAPSGFSALYIENITGTAAFNIFTANNHGAIAPNLPVDEAAVWVLNVPDPGVVSFGTLNVSNAAEIIGVRVDTVNRFTSGGGSVDVLNQTAVDINDSDINAVFTSVSSTTPPEVGILLTNNLGLFAVTGNGATLGSGGTITGAPVAGIDMLNQERASFSFMDITGNGIGIRGDTMDSLFLDSLQIMGSLEEGVRLFDVQTFEVEDSFFTDNGVTGPQQQHIRAIMTVLHPDPDIDDDTPYDYLIERNLFQDGTPIAGDDAVFIATQASAAGSQLDLIFQDNTAMLDRTNASFLHVQWNGQLNATIQDNNFTTAGSDDMGFEIRTLGLGFGANVVIDNNVGTFGGINDSVGTLFNFAGPANVSFTFNEFLFAGENATGLQLTTLAGNNNIFIADNVLTFNDEGSTGMIFPITNAPAFFTIEGNQINLTNFFFAPAERGIIFTAVNGVVNLFGTRDNFVNIPGTPFDPFPIFFQIPPGASQGQFLLNGVPVP